MLWGTFRLPLVVGLLVCSAMAEASLWVFTRKINFIDNHTLTDRNVFYQDANGDPQNPLVGWGIDPLVEFDTTTSYPQPERIAYTKGDTIRAEVVLYNSSGTAITANYCFDWVKFDIPATFRNENPVTLDLVPPASQFVSIGAGQTSTLNVEITGVPFYVALGELRWQVHLYALSGAPVGSDLISDPVGSTGPTEWKLYLTNAEPDGLQTPVWADLLDYTCDWASYSVTDEETAQWIALGMYWASNWVYEGQEPQWYIEPSLFHDTTAFKLRSALTPSAEFAIDCRDVSGFVFLANQGQGIPGYLTRLTPQLIASFGTNLLSPMGNDATVDEHPCTGDNTYRYYNFTFHQVPILLGGVYDAAAAHRVDLAGSLYRNVPTGWSLGGYWQTPNSTYDFVGLVRGLANSTPETAGTAEALSASTDTKSIDGYDYD